MEAEMNKDQPIQLPDDFIRFIEMFNAGEYWESHEVLEGPWREHRSRFYRGMIIYASAFVHAQRGNPKGVYNQIVKVERYLTDYKPHYMGIDITRLLAHAGLCKNMVDRERLSKADQVPPAGEILANTLPYDRLEIDDRLVRGDEPELHS